MSNETPPIVNTTNTVLSGSNNDDVLQWNSILRQWEPHTSQGLGIDYSTVQTFTNITPSTSTTTGAVKIAGGIGVVGNANVGGVFQAGSIITTGTVTASKLVVPSIKSVNLTTKLQCFGDSYSQSPNSAGAVSYGGSYVNYPTGNYGSYSPGSSQTDNWFEKVCSTYGKTPSSWAVGGTEWMDLNVQTYNYDDGVSSSLVLTGINDVNRNGSNGLTTTNAYYLFDTMFDNILYLSLPAANKVMMRAGASGVTRGGTWINGPSFPEGFMRTQVLNSTVSCTVVGRYVYLSALRGMTGTYGYPTTSTGFSTNCNVQIDGVTCVTTGQTTAPTFDGRATASYNDSIGLQNTGYTSCGIVYDTGSSDSTSHTVVVTNKLPNGANFQPYYVAGWSPSTVMRSVVVGSIPYWINCSAGQDTLRLTMNNLINNAVNAVNSYGGNAFYWDNNYLFNSSYISTTQPRGIYTSDLIHLNAAGNQLLFQTAKTFINSRL
jgi:hypothetical protein